MHLGRDHSPARCCSLNINFVQSLCGVDINSDETLPRLQMFGITVCMSGMFLRGVKNVQNVFVRIFRTQ